MLPKFGRWPAGAIDKAEVRRWVADIIRAGVSPSRARQAVSALRGVLELAVDAGALRVNPAAGIKLPRVTTPEMLFLDERQVAELAEAMEPPYGLAVTFAAYTGLRAGEMWASKVRNVDLLGRKCGWWSRCPTSTAIVLRQQRRLTVRGRCLSPISWLT